MIRIERKENGISVFFGFWGPLRLRAKLSLNFKLQANVAPPAYTELGFLILLSRITCI